MIRLNSHYDYDYAQLEKKLNGQLELILPGMISKSIINYLPTYLRDNSKIKKIVDRHLESVREATREEIEKIVNEPKYHLVNNSFYDSIEEQANERIDNTLESVINIQNELLDLKNQLSNVKLVLGLGTVVLFIKTVFF